MSIFDDCDHLESWSDHWTIAAFLWDGAMFLSCAPRLMRLIVVIAALFALPVFAEEPPTDPNVAFMLSTAQAYGTQIGTATERPLKLHSRPALKWTNPVSGIEHGLLVLWHDGNRPAVFAQVFKLPAPQNLWLHEGQSIIAEPLRFSLGEKRVWSPSPSTAAFKTLEKVEPPVEKPAARLVQARAIARRFAASEDFRTTEKTAVSRFELRLSPQPVYQYTSEKHGVLSGTVFAFVNGTDPEVLLVVEAFRDDQATGWRYLLAPMTCWAVAATWDGAPVWQVEEQLGKTGRGDPYYAWGVDKTLLVNDPTTVPK